MNEGEHYQLIAELVNTGAFPGGNICAIDGLRVDFEDGFGLARASNTVIRRPEPLIPSNTNCTASAVNSNPKIRLTTFIPVTPRRRCTALETSIRAKVIKRTSVRLDTIASCFIKSPSVFAINSWSTSRSCRAE